MATLIERTEIAELSGHVQGPQSGWLDLESVEVDIMIKYTSEAFYDVLLAEKIANANEPQRFATPLYNELFDSILGRLISIAIVRNSLTDIFAQTHGAGIHVASKNGDLTATSTKTLEAKLANCDQRITKHVGLLNRWGRKHNQTWAKYPECADLNDGTQRVVRTSRWF